MEALVAILKQIAKENPLEEKFKEEIPQGCPICKKEKFQGKTPPDCPICGPSKKKSIYKRNICLKEKLHLRIMKNGKKSKESLGDYYWIIQDWGGIRAFKGKKKNDQRIKGFIDELGKGELTPDSFSVISSLSKVASFIKPDEYVIYDSRVIFSLNWLLFSYTDKKILFKQPSGQNQTLKKYDMPTIFHLSKRGIEYWIDKSSYHQYCKLINHLAPLVFGLGSRPYKLEMLLYTIAAEKDKDSWIVEDIKKRASIEIASVA